MGRAGRAATVLTLIAALFGLGSGQAHAVSSNIVISGAFAGGGLSGAPYKNDYIELLNTSSSPVDVTGWTVQAASGFSSFGSASDVTLAGSIPANSYFLVGEASGGANGSALPTPDATGTADLDTRGAKVRIIDGSSTVIDLLGWLSNEYEGSPVNVALQNDTALDRRHSGCVDTDNNASDFEFVEPAVARNIATPTHVCAPNQAPVLDHIADQNGTTHHEIAFTVTGSDPDGDPITFSASNLPPGASFDDSDTHQFIWIPQPGQEGVYSNVQFSVSDGIDTTSQPITITVTTGTDTPPVIDPIADQTTHPGKELDFFVTGSDADGDPLTYGAPNLPSGAFFDTGGELNQFSWTPGQSDLGSHPGIAFTVFDGTITATTTMTINVTQNHPPVIDPIATKTVTAGHTLSFQVTGSDPDSDAITFSASHLPTGASFDPSTQTFSWRPLQADVGSHTGLQFTVNDGLASVSTTMEIDVLADHAPVIDAIGDKTVNAGRTLSFQVTGHDPDADPVTFSASNLPPGASFDQGTQMFAWTPTPADLGSYPNVTFTIDDSLLNASTSITITVNLNHAPVLAPIGNKRVLPGHTLAFVISARDVDRDPLTFSTSRLPRGARFRPGTRRFSWTPTAGQRGTYRVTFIVSDGLAIDHETIKISVA